MSPHSLARIATSWFLVTAFAISAQVQAPDVPQTTAVPNPTSIDKKVDPCKDFYQYACGNWLATNSIPPDRASWGTGEMLVERNRLVLRDILEKASNRGADRSAPEQEIGDYYFACMDQRTAATRGYDPIKPELARIDALADKEAVRDEVPRLHRQGNDAFFEFGSEADLKDSEHTIGAANQGGLGLPDRDFYLKDDAKFDTGHEERGDREAGSCDESHRLSG